MSSTYSTSLRIQLIDTNTEFEAWGQPLDNNLGTIIEQAITGSNTISLTNLTTYTLTTANAAVDQARNAVLVFNGSLTANCNVVAPSVNKVYIVKNQTTGGKTVNMKTATGNAVPILANTTQLVYCNSLDFVNAFYTNNITGNFRISGNSTVNGNVTVGSNVSIGSNLISTSGNLSLVSSTSNVVNFQASTGGLIPAVGTTAQRPSSPVNGMSRWNTDLAAYEIWNGSIWQNITGFYTITYLVVAGGGSGAVANYREAGGGGAGGLLTSTASFKIGVTYSIIVGAGGAANPGGGGQNQDNIAPGISGGISSLIGGSVSVSASGGGGASYGSYDAPLPGAGGGSGGGGGGRPAATNGGAGIPGQGNNGGNGTDSGSYGGSGGGAGSAGTTNGSGGAGLSSSITGTSVTYATGGAVGSGASGGTNTGNGGGGALNDGNAGAGGSGIVVLSIPTINYTGITTGSPTVVVNGSNTILIFTSSSGSYTA
jgi:hypothetical protein